MNSPNPIFDHPAVLLLLDHRRPHTPTTITQIHAHLITTGLALHTYPLSRLLLISTSSSSSSLPISYPLSILHHFPRRPTTFLFNTLISSLAARRLLRPALLLYSRLLLPSSPKPNAHTFPSLLSACASLPQFHPHGRAIHAHLIKYLIHTLDPFIPAALVAFYSRLNNLPVCRRVFDRISNTDLPTWNSIIAAYASSGEQLEALVLFQKLQLSLTRPNEITIVALIKTCGDLGALSQGGWAHTYVKRNGLAVNCFVGTALVDMYAKCGRLDLAEQVFDEMPQRDTTCYNTMIGALGVHGDGGRAVGLFRRMGREGVGVDEVTMVAVMCACAHAGMVEEGRRWFYSMGTEFGIEPKVEHYGCLVDLLGRAGRLEEAEGVIRRMPVEANAVMYRSLLGACRIHGNMEMGERMIGRLVELEPEHVGQYVLLSNMYAEVDGWDEVRRVREKMKDKGIKKSAGCSSVEMDGSIHEFVTGDKAHPRSKEIFAMINGIDRSLHEEFIS